VPESLHDDFFLKLREQFKSEEEYKDYIANIFSQNAYELFGQMLSFLCEKSLLSQREIGKRSIGYRNYLRQKRRIPVKGKTKDVGQSGISRVINVLREPSYDQIFIWFHVLREHFKSDEYKQKCEEMNDKVFEFTQDFEDDMWRLALFSPPRKVIGAFVRHEETVY